VEPPALFTLESAQALLDSTVRALAEELVQLRSSSLQLEKRWRGVVMAVSSNGGNMRAPDVQALRDQLEAAHARLRDLLDEITGHGVQVKDLERGLLDFPAERDGQIVLLCWMVGEERIAFWHTTEAGFAGREPL
jgi:hypothetical protein